MSGMVKAYNQVLSLQIGSNIVSMTIVEKQNESGIFFNQRLLILVHDHYFGYISKVKMNQQPEKVNPNEAKVKVPIKNLYTCEVDENILNIKFTHEVEGRLDPKEWIIKVTTPKLAELWKQLLDYEVKQMSKPKASQLIKKSSHGGSRKSSKEQQIQKSSDKLIKKSENEAPRKEVNSSLKKSGKKIQMQGSFDNSLFDDESDEEDSKRKKTDLGSKNRKSPSPKKSSSESQEIMSPRVEPQPEKKLIKQQNNKETQENLYPNKGNPPKYEEKNKQLSLSTPTKEENASKNEEKSRPSNLDPLVIEESPPKKIQQKMGRQQLNLPLIVEQPREDTPDSGSKSLKRQESKQRKSMKKGFSRSSIKYSETKQLTAEEKDIALIADIIGKMQQKNNKFPFNQITYDHNEFLKFLTPYKSKLLTAPSNPKQLERIMEAVLDRMRGKQQKNRTTNSQANWIYRQITEDQPKVILAFQQYCSQLMYQLVMGLCSGDFVSLSKTKNEQNLIYLENDQVQVKVPLIVLEDSKQNEQIKLINCQTQKKIKNQFKALKYLHQIIESRGNLRVPLACLCQYGGIVALFKAKAVYYQNDKYCELLNKELNRLQDVSCLPLKKLLKDSIKPLDQFHYNQMRKGDTSVSFKFHFVDEVSKLFVYDLNLSKHCPTKFLRMQLIEKEINRKILPYVTLEDLQMDESSSAGIEIANLSHKINEKIEKIAANFNNMEFTFIQPKELSKLIHSYGVNMRYLAAIYSKVDDQFSKSLLLSEMMSRIIKQLYSKAFQDSCLEQKNSYNNTEEMQYSLKNKVTDFFNCLFGNNLQSDALWKLVYANAENYYGVPVQKCGNLCKGQLLLSLAYHCSAVFNWKQINAMEIFKTQRFFKPEQIKEAAPKLKSYSPQKDTYIQSIIQKLKNQSYENFEWIVSNLNLKKQKIPEQLALLELTDPLRLYLANFIEPDQMDWNNDFSKVSIYCTDTPSSSNFNIDLVMVKWFLRKNNKFKYLGKFNDISNKLQKLYGNNHPFLSDLYQIFSDYHKSKGEIEDSISFMKSSILNISAICGDSNRGITQKNFKMFKLLLAVNRETEAYDYLGKARKTLENSPTKKVSLYGKIKLQYALKLFKQHREEQVLKELQNVSEFFQIYEKQQTSFEEEREKVYQLLYLCLIKLNKKEQLIQLSRKLEQKMKYFKNHSHFQQLLWIVVETKFKNTSKQNREALNGIIKTIKVKQSIQYYKKSLSFLLRRSNEKSLIELLSQYFQNASKIVQMVMKERVLDSWTTLSTVYERESLFDFVSLVEELIYFFGRDRLNSIQY